MNPSIKNRLIYRLIESESVKKRFRRIDTLFYRMDVRRRFDYDNSRLSRLPQEDLTDDEYERAKKLWPLFCLDSFKFYKAFCGYFDEHFVPNDYYDMAEHVFNLRWASYFLQHKCNLKYVVPSTYRPESILQKIDGHYVFEDNREISESEARGILLDFPQFVRKVALGIGGGRGVMKVVWSDVEDKKSALDELLKGNDIIFQKVIEQDDFIAQFNPDSVNTYRLLTLNINGCCTVLSSFLRMGAKGSFVDNLCSGGGVLVGINSEGEINDFGVNKEYKKIYQAPTGLKFKGIGIPNWQRVKESVVDYHRNIPQANLIGWDIAIDKNGTPIVVEINLDSAAVEAHQIFNGPVFGERFDEVRDYIRNRIPMLRHSMITY